MNSNEMKVKLAVTAFSKKEGRSVSLVDGTYANRGNLHTIKYTEVGEGMEGTETKVIFNSDHATVTRTGTINSKMEFYPGTMKPIYYETPFGSLNMELETDKVYFRQVGSGYEGKIIYRINLGAGKEGTDSREFKLQVTPCE